MRKVNFNYLIFLFSILTFIGGILEISYVIIFKNRFSVGGFFHAPIRPIYGFGGLLLYLLPKKLKSNNILLFISSFIVCTIFEYLSSFLIEIIFDKVLWNYSKFAFNINGRICLQHSIIWGFLGVIFYHFIEPFIFKLYNINISDKLSFRSRKNI